MTHREKVDYLIEDMRDRGLGASTVAPPLFRLLWALGLEIPPPLFLGFVPLTLFMGFLFGVFWGLFMALAFLIWLSFQVGPNPEAMLTRGAFVLIVVALGAACAGVLFGLTMAGYLRWKAAKLGLPSWDQYPAHDWDDDADDTPLDEDD